nr:immunoglobulin light chain junction region [Macaca mulatta]
DYYCSSYVGTNTFSF